MFVIPTYVSGVGRGPTHAHPLLFVADEASRTAESSACVWLRKHAGGDIYSAVDIARRQHALSPCAKALSPPTIADEHTL